MPGFMGTKRRAAAASYFGISEKRQAAQFKKPVFFPGGLSYQAADDVLCGVLREVRDDGGERRVEDGETAETRGSAGVLCER